jgi:hypothetical protein
MSKPNPFQSQIQLPYHDVPQIAEVFGDNLQSCAFDGHVVKLVFASTRMEGEPKPPNPPTMKRYTTCRLVLAAAAADQLLQNLTQLKQLLETAKQGQVVAPTKQ